MSYSLPGSIASSLNPSNLWNRLRQSGLRSAFTPSSYFPSPFAGPSRCGDPSASTTSPRPARSVHWPDGSNGDPAAPYRIPVEQKGFNDSFDKEQKRSEIAAKLPKSIRDQLESVANGRIHKLNRHRTRRGLEELSAEEAAPIRKRAIDGTASKCKYALTDGYDPDYVSSITGHGLNGKAADTYRDVGIVFGGLGQPLTEDTRQSIVRGALAKTYGDKLSGVRMSNWQDSAKPVPSWFATQLTAAEHQSSECREAALRWLSEKDKSDNPTRTDEQRMAEYNQTRYHRFNTDDLPNDRIREEYKEASKLPTLTSEALDFNKLSAEDKKLVTDLTTELDARKERGDTMKSIYAYVGTYCREHRKRPEWVPSEDGQSFNIDPSALETYGKVTGKLGDGTEVTFERIKVDPGLEPTETRVCITGPNPYYTIGYQAEVDKLNYSKYETLRTEYNDKIKKTQEERSRRIEEATRLTPLSLPSADTPPTNFTQWATGGNATTNDRAGSVALLRANAAHTVASAVSSAGKMSYDKTSRLGERLVDSLGKSIVPSEDPQQIAIDGAKLKQMKTETESYLQKAGASSSVNFDKDIYPAVVSAFLEGKSLVGPTAWDERPEAEWLKRPGQSTAEPYSDAGQLARLCQVHDMMTALSRLNEKLSLDQLTRLSTYMSDLGPDSQKVSAFLQAAMKQLSADPGWKLSKNDDRWKSHLTTSTASATTASADSSATGGTSTSPST